MSWQNKLCNCVLNDDIPTLQNLLSQDIIRNKIKEVESWNAGKYEIPLHEAARLGGVSHLTTLLNAKAKVNSFAIKGQREKYTTLHVAIMHDKMDVVRILLQYGADKTISGNKIEEATHGETNICSINQE